MVNIPLRTGIWRANESDCAACKRERAETTLPVAQIANNGNIDEQI